MPGWIKAGYPTLTVEKFPKVDVALVTAAELKQMMDENSGFVMVDIRIGNE